MATATTSPRSAKAAKPAAKKASTARKAAAARRRLRGTRTQAKARKAKSARTRSIHQTQSAARQTEIAARNTVDVFGDYTERAVLIPVGAALIARDRVVSSVNDVVSSYGSTTKAQAQLRRFERRGHGAQPARARGPQSPRPLRARTAPAPARARSKTVSSLEERRDAVAKNVTELAEPRPGAHPQPRLSTTPSPAPDLERPGARESLSASYPAGSSSNLSSPRPAGRPPPPAGHFKLRGRPFPTCAAQVDAAGMPACGRHHRR